MSRLLHTRHIPSPSHRPWFYLLLRRQYSPMQTLASLMDFSQSALYFDLSFQFVILHLSISVCTQVHHLYFGRPLSRLHWGLLWNTWLNFSFTVHPWFHHPHNILWAYGSWSSSLCTFLQSRHVWGNSYSNRKSSSRHTVLCIANTLIAERSGVRIPATTKDFSLLQKVQTRSGA